MLDFLYTLFIAPLEYWMHAALLWGYGKTADWGEAVLIMSLVVNFVILPIYMKAEKWQEDVISTLVMLILHLKNVATAI